MTTATPTARHLVAVPAETTESEHERSLTVIPGRLDRAARVARAIGTTLFTALIIGLVGALILRASMIESQQQLDALRVEVEQLRADTESLQHELAELEAPARIVVEARDLGMIDAPTITYLTTPAGALDQRTLGVAENQLRSR